MNQYDVFISYSRKDSDIVFPIVKKLEDNGLSVWIDRDGVESGDAFKSVIVGGIKKSNIFLFFSSANANESPWTVKEVDTAVYLKKKIIPVKLDEADYADSILFDIAGLDFADLSIEEKKEAEWNKLIASLLSKKPSRLREKDNAIILSAEELCKKGYDFYKKRLYIEAFPYFKKSAEQGHADAQFTLGYMYEYGQGVDQDYKQAVYWYRKLAEQGDADAQCNIGFMYDEGQGVDQDKKQAVYWYRKSAEQGLAEAQCNLGYMYEYGQGVDQDKKQAVYWYRKSAEQGYAPAQNNLGEMYAKGQGVDQDKKQAVYWYRKSAEQGLAEAQCNLGVMYDEGQGVDQDKKQAVYWYRKSAEQGYAEAQCNLGVMYEKGQGVDQDKKQAVYWYRKATEQGNADAKKRLKELENKL